jgi:hypothetical protein
MSARGEFATWTYSGSIPRGADLELLESALHTGRVDAAERGFTDDPDILTEDVMRVGSGAEVRLVNEDEAVDQGLDFRPDTLRFLMTWRRSADS